MSGQTEPQKVNIAESGRRRLYLGQTAINFFGRRLIGVVVSSLLLAVTIISLTVQGLNLGIDFEGGTSWDVPASSFTVADADDVLGQAEIDTEGSRIQVRDSESGSFVKVQVRSISDAEAREVRQLLADAAGSSVDDINVNVVSASWGSDITNKAIRALVIFLIVVAIFISFRFEWRMAVAAILAMVHDVVISVGIYSLFGFVVTPATVIAFLTILGYSLYDTIVVFDRVKENETRFAQVRVGYGDVVNVSMNQVLMRSTNTSISSVLPVIALLVIGSGVLGASTLSEFAIALLIGMLMGTYSSVFVASPTLAMLKLRAEGWKKEGAEHVRGEDLRTLVLGGSVSRRVRSGESAASKGSDTSPSSDAASVLQHDPRPRKKRRR
ncbi:MAG: protein translocase subunit SecF [Actinomycetota bacterium]|nr:protein translocase subunit SecF [Acidimicrobiaceae bacterium]MEC7665752.1 protein translocase subunit SecF [Actinomycetota bacterium]MEC8487074.1 protein translocase subunit SecF [Actinomycetota bacterium]MEC8522475.1 protein translocase subunit SecF [Actinomycetota bacterium]MEC9224903.1 protein translocase subunit SecF [Actinomycetota bacterium]